MHKSFKCLYPQQPVLSLDSSGGCIGPMHCKYWIVERLIECLLAVLICLHISTKCANFKKKNKYNHS